MMWESWVAPQPPWLCSAELICTHPASTACPEGAGLMDHELQDPAWPGCRGLILHTVQTQPMCPRGPFIQVLSRILGVTYAGGAGIYKALIGGLPAVIQKNPTQQFSVLDRAYIANSFSWGCRGISVATTGFSEVNSCSSPSSGASFLFGQQS